MSIVVLKKITLFGIAREKADVLRELQPLQGLQHGVPANAIGGADPLELLEAYGHAVRLVHIKDCDLQLLAEVCRSGGGMTEAWDRGVFCELGLGTAGLEPFLEALKAHGYEGWVTVEQDRFVKDEDTPEALLALHTRNRDWLRARGL